MDPITLETLIRYCEGTCLHPKELPPALLALRISEIKNDSREIGRGDFYIAFVGERFDGHQFVSDVAARGAEGAIVNRSALSEEVIAALPTRFILIEVDDTVRAYQKIAAGYRRQHKDLRVIAITGSSGKTSVKDFTAAVLSQKYKVLKTTGNFNNHIGVPRMLLSLTSEHEVAVLEMGMNHAGELAPLVEIAQPEIGIITNVGITHIEHLKTQDAIAEEKGTVIRHLPPTGLAILKDTDFYTKLLRETTLARVITVGLQSGDVRAEILKQDLGGSTFQMEDTQTGQTTEASLPVPGAHMVENALFAVAAGLALGIPLATCALGLADTQLTKGRLQIREINGLRVIDDSYNASPDSMIAGLKTLASMPLPKGGRRIAVLGRMGELGDQELTGHQQVGAAAGQMHVDILIGVGATGHILAESAQAGGCKHTHFVQTPQEAGTLLQTFSLRPEDLILVKGSRSAKMELCFSTFLS